MRDRAQTHAARADALVDGGMSARSASGRGAAAAPAYGNSPPDGAAEWAAMSGAERVARMAANDHALHHGGFGALQIGYSDAARTPLGSGGHSARGVPQLRLVFPDGAGGGATAGSATARSTGGGAGALTARGGGLSARGGGYGSRPITPPPNIKRAQRP